MRVLHTIGGFGLKRGGTTTCTYTLLCSMRQMGYDVDLLTPDIAPDSDDTLVGLGEHWIKRVSYDCKTPYAYSRNQRRYLRTFKYDIYHTNGLWMYINEATCAMAIRYKKPYIISTHGMLYPQALRRSAIKKRVMMGLVYGNCLKHAACIHATCLQEADYLRSLGVRTPIAVIGNPVEGNCDNIRPTEKLDAIGYIGRIHERKNIDCIIQAFGDISVPSQKLIIVGEGDEDVESRLRMLARSRNLDNVEFMGFVVGEEKYRIMSCLKATVLASDFENFGMTVGESLMCRTPVICTRTAPWSVLEELNCGRWIANDRMTIGRHMAELLYLPSSEIYAMGSRGREYVRSNFSPEIIARQMGELYEWIVGDRVKPEFVI